MGTHRRTTKRKSSVSSKSRLTKIPVQTYLEPQQVKALKALSDLTRVPQQKYIREGVDMVLEHYSPENMHARYIELRSRAARQLVAPHKRK
jgi:hypothetical protein